MSLDLSRDEYLSRVNEVLNALTALNNQSINIKVAALKEYVALMHSKNENSANLDSAICLLTETQTLAENHMRHHEELVRKYLLAQQTISTDLTELHNQKQQLLEKKIHLKYLQSKHMRKDTIFLISFLVSLSIVITATAIAAIFIPNFWISFVVASAIFLFGNGLTWTIADICEDWPHTDNLQEIQLKIEIHQLELDVEHLKNRTQNAELDLSNIDYQDQFSMLSESISALLEEWIDEKPILETKEFEVVNKKDEESKVFLSETVCENLYVSSESNHSFFKAVESNDSTTVKNEMSAIQKAIN